MMARSSLYVVGIFWLIFVFNSLPAYCANASAITSSIDSTAITPEFLQKKIDSLNARQGLDDTTKNAVLKLYQSAQDNLNSGAQFHANIAAYTCLLYTSPSPRDTERSRMPSSA